MKINIGDKRVLTIAMLGEYRETLMLGFWQVWALDRCLLMHSPGSPGSVSCGAALPTASVINGIPQTCTVRDEQWESWNMLQGWGKKSGTGKSCFYSHSGPGSSALGLQCNGGKRMVLAIQYLGDARCCVTVLPAGSQLTSAQIRHPA